jgi:hypothetical protein
MLTEDQARTKWCPMVRVAMPAKIDKSEALTKHNTAIVGGLNTEPLGGNRVPASCRCIASDCAMWVWARPNIGTTPTITYVEGQRETVDGKEPRGRCGLARVEP